MSNTYDISGTCVESCTCGAGCACCSPGGTTRDTCHMAAAWNIDSGRYGSTQLGGLHLVGVYDVSCADGNPRGTLYAEDKASPEQRRALEAMFTGQRCDYPASMQALVQNFQAIRYTHLTVSESGGKFHVEVPGVVSSTLEMIPVGAPAPVAAKMEVAEEHPAPRRYGFHSRFRWIG